MVKQRTFTKLGHRATGLAVMAVLGLGLLALGAADAAPRRGRKAPAKKAPVVEAPVQEEAAPEPVVEAAAPASADPAAAPAGAPADPASATAAEAPLEKPQTAAAEAAAAAAPPSRQTVDRLRAQYDELRDAVFSSRARRETLEKALFSTKLLLSLEWDGNRNYTLSKAEIRLDGSRVWDSGDRPVGEDPVVLATRSVPPGPHVLGLRIEVRSRDNPRLGYVAEQSFSLSLAEGKETRVELTVDEEGSLPSFNPDIEIDIDD